MPLNPFQYQYEATYLTEEGEEATIELKQGARNQTIKIPKTLLPSEFKPGSSFVVKIQDPESAKQTEMETLKSLLQSLIE